MSAPEETTTPISSIPAESYGAVTATGAVGLPAGLEPDPDNPPWNILTAVLTWVGSVIMLFGMSAVSLLFIMLYFTKQYGGVSPDQLGHMLTTDKVAVLLQVISVIPAHLLTLALAWAVVTSIGKRPFWQTLGWSWSSRVGPWTSIGLAVLVLGAGGVLTKLVGGEATEVDAIVASSMAARISIAVLATLTAPLVEELIYRGLLYSALQRVMGRLLSVLFVSFLFAFVHVFQYSNNLGVIAAITIFSLSLTLMRAYSGRLLPCYVMHLVFNGLQSIVILFEPYMQQSGGGEQKATIIYTVMHLLQNLS